jgi:hypothetical protein
MDYAKDTSAQGLGMSSVDVGIIKSLESIAAQLQRMTVDQDARWAELKMSRLREQESQDRDRETWSARLSGIESKLTDLETSGLTATSSQATKRSCQSFDSTQDGDAANTAAAASWRGDRPTWADDQQLPAVGEAGSAAAAASWSGDRHTWADDQQLPAVGAAGSARSSDEDEEIGCQARNLSQRNPKMCMLCHFEFANKRYRNPYATPIISHLCSHNKDHMLKAFDENAQCKFLADLPEHKRLLYGVTGATMQDKWLTVVTAWTVSRSKHQR